MQFFSLFLWIAAADLSIAARESWGLRGPKPSLDKRQRRAPINRRQASSCDSSSQLTTKAPKPNIFAGLTDQETADVTSFLHDQTALNLTVAANATR